MKKAALVARVLLGLVFFVFGLNGFFNFLPPPELPEPAGKYLGAMIDSGYQLKFVKATETVSGALLLLGQFVPLALVILAPVILNIVAFHLFLAPSGIAVPLVIVALELFLAYAYRASFAGALNRGARPS